MTEQRKYTLKVILAVVLILALPSFFFQYIETTRYKSQKTQQERLRLLTKIME